MAARVTLAFALAALGAGAPSGCFPSGTATTDPAAAEPALTAEAAKQALLARMRADRLFGFDADRWAREDVGEARDGWHEFGGSFRINPVAKRYTARVGPPPGVRGCTFEFEGSFSLRDGRWVADDPVEVRSALGGGQ